MDLSNTVVNLGLTVGLHSKEDTIIFCIGAVFTFFCFWLIWHYLG